MTTNQDGSGDRLLKPSEVAELFHVNPKTIARWASNGCFKTVRTPGGHRRFWRSEIMSFIESRNDPE